MVVSPMFFSLWSLFVFVVLVWTPHQLVAIDFDGFSCDVENRSLALHFLIDSSASMEAVLAELKQPVAQTSSFSSLAYSLQVAQQYFQFASASVIRFQDKPVEPFGAPDDLCFNLITTLNNDPSLIEVITQSLEASGGGDVADSQWDALYVGLLSIPLLPGTDEIFILVTDSQPHAAPQPSMEWAPAPAAPGFYDCSNFAYPSAQQIGGALKARNPYARLLILTTDQWVNFYSSELMSVLQDDKLIEVLPMPTNGEEVEEMLNATDRLVCGSTTTTTTATTASSYVCTPESFDIQVFHLQDISDSFKKDLRTVKVQLNAAFEWLSDAFHTSEFALATFSDVPEKPFGQPHVDHCYYERLTPFTDDPEEALDIVNAIQTVSGADWPEAQLHALLKAAQSESAAWSYGETSPEGYWRLRAIVLATDAGFHVAGDRPQPSPPQEEEEGNCITSDYPDIHVVAEALRARDIRPVFLVTSDLKPVYDALLEDFNMDGAVITLDNDAQNLLEALQKGLEVICGIETRRLVSQHMNVLAPF